MRGREFKVKEKVWLYKRPNNLGAWHFVTIDKDTSAEIKSFETYPRRGFGAIKVKVTIGKTS